MKKWIKSPYFWLIIYLIAMFIVVAYHYYLYYGQPVL